MLPSKLSSSPAIGEATPAGSWEHFLYLLPLLLLQSLLPLMYKQTLTEWEVGIYSFSKAFHIGWEREIKEKACNIWNLN